MSTRLDPSGGREQSFIQDCPFSGAIPILYKKYYGWDCEVCCRPIQIRVRFEGGEVAEFYAETGD